ncbi:hypothetical protein L596_013343 [Steinernema carpocapsae]|uniref:Uncharacterized protein n=1 Tax=Steinernema carpocapsae TaxID=34508 RepID=A0A4U5P0R0_STECR|nr:hypothetical protein L596_013343 [Steinernema carpocapsae]
MRFVNAAPIHFIVTVLKTAKHFYGQSRPWRALPTSFWAGFSNKWTRLSSGSKSALKARSRRKEPEERMGRSIAVALVSLSVVLYSPSFILKMKATNTYVKTSAKQASREVTQHGTTSKRNADQESIQIADAVKQRKASM